MVTPRRPPTEEERPYLQALGAEVRELRLAALPTRDEVAARAVLAHGRLPHALRVTQAILGARAQLSAGQVGTIEQGRARTRRSTLERIVRALVDEDVAGEVLEHLVEVAGPALAPEAHEAHIQRIIARRERRSAKNKRRELQLLQQSARDLRSIRMAGDIGRRIEATVARLDAKIARLQAAAAAELEDDGTAAEMDESRGSGPER